MAKLKFTEPVVGETNAVADPLIPLALAEIKTVVNGELNSENIKAEGVAKEDLSAELKTELASFVGLPLQSKKSIIATEQERESATFGTLSTPDEVEVTVGANGLLVFGYRASWESSVSEAGRAAIFIGANQLKSVAAATVLETTQRGAGMTVLRSSPEGLLGSSEVTAATQVTTGQALGEVCYIFVAAGTYKVSVRFRATSGKVKVKERKLWAYVIG